MADAEKSGPIE